MKKNQVYVDIEKSARLLRKVLFDDIKLKKDGKRIHDLWKLNFTWDQITKKYERLYYEVCDE
jgi:hypothetical protein